MSFSKLPTEIRLRIYEELFGHHDIYVGLVWEERQSRWRWAHYVCSDENLETVPFQWKLKSFNTGFEPELRAARPMSLKQLGAGLLFCCQQTYLEGIESIYQTNKFKLDVSSAPLMFAERFQEKHPHSRIRHLDIDWDESVVPSDPEGTQREHATLWQALEKLVHLRTLRIAMASMPRALRGLVLSPLAEDGLDHTAAIEEWIESIDKATCGLELDQFEIVFPFEVTFQLREAFEETPGRRLSIKRFDIHGWNMANLFPDSEDDLGNSFE